ncbi:MAG: uroporphyrinogen-III synthase [Hyphomicrobiales bacterium]|nr:uroporphyrinogen-III synthase [Hyphomicrobiales bacterium]
MKVLVTRPEPGASRTADILRGRGHEPVLMPLTRIVELLPDGSALDATDAGACAVTSANAVRSLRALGISSERLKSPLYAVGERTGDVARQAGFSDVRTGVGDGAGLAGKIIADLKSGNLWLSASAPLLYAAGKTRHSQFEAALAAQQTPVAVVELYGIEEISYSTDFVNSMFLDQRPDAVLLYSGKSAELFFGTLDKIGMHNTLKNCQFFCMSKNVSDIVPSTFRQQIVVAEKPNEEKLLMLLDQSDNLF